MYYNEIQRNRTSNFSQLFVRLEPVDLPELEAVVSALRDSFRATPTRASKSKQFEQGPPIEAPIAIRVFGEDLDSPARRRRASKSCLSQPKRTLCVNNPLKNYTHRPAAEHQHRQSRAARHSHQRDRQDRAHGTGRTSASRPTRTKRAKIIPSTPRSGATSTRSFRAG